MSVMQSVVREAQRVSTQAEDLLALLHISFDHVTSLQDLSNGVGVLAKQAYGELPLWAT